jgi:murein DD-endopeptidase MepM/ murein hydrolase activator NlpD
VLIMEISYLPAKFIIKTTKTSDRGGGAEDIFVLRALRIKNILQDSISIQELMYNLKSEGETQKLLTYTREILSSRAENMTKLLDFIGKPKQDPYEEQKRNFEYLNFLGQNPFWDVDRFTANTDLQPMEETGTSVEVFRNYLMHPVDELEILVKFEINGEVKTSSVSVPIKTYTTKNDYIFPLKGEWLVWGNWDVTAASHRMMHSQEFAMDFVQLNENLTLPQVEKTRNEDFKMYGKDILAVADGEVIAINDSAPENPTAPEMPSPEEQDELNKKYGFYATTTGNHVIIRHPHDEYSCYAHLVTDSALVKKGEKVHQGQVIGKLGNSGASAAPHLHFQIMDGPNFLTARGIPCYFSNIVDFLGKKISLIQDNLTIVHTTDS